MRIQTKILFIVFALILVVGVVATIVSQTVSKNIVTQQIYNHLETTAQSRAHHIETFLETEKKAIKQLSESIVIERFLSANKGDRDYIQKFNDVMRRLEHTARVREYDHGLFVLDKSGTIVASSEETDIGKDKSGDPYFLGGKQGAFIKDAYVSQDRKMNSLAFSAPVFDEENIVFLGVVVSRVSMEELNRITTDRSGLRETGEIYLVNKDGYMITPSRFVKNTFLKRKVDTENVRNCLAHEHKEHIRCEAVTLFKDYRGVEILGAHAFIEEMNWCLLAEMDEKEALAPVAKITHTMLSILALLSVLGGILSILISRTITKPIVKLHEGTEEIEKGNLDHKVGTRARDEIGQLSRAFDSMTANLKKSKEKLEEYSRSLEKKVEERTRQLEEKVEESEKQRVATFNLLQDVNQARNELEKTKEELEEYSAKLVEVNESLKTEITERKRTEEALQASQKKYRTLIEVAQEGIGLTDIHENFTYVNQALADILDYSKEELVGLNLEQLCDKEQFRAIRNETEKRRQGKLSRYEAELYTKTGERKYFTVAATPLYDENGEFTGTLGLLNDITERKRAEEKLLESERKFRTLVEQLPAIIYTAALDESSTTLYISPQIEKILGISPAEYKVDPDFWVKHLYPGDRERVLNELSRSHESGQPFNSEYRMVTQDGRLVWLGDDAVIVRDDKGNPLHLQGVMFDITERKRAEEALKESEEKFRTFMETASDLMHIADKNGNYTYVNESMARTLGYSKEEMLGMHVTQNLSKEILKEVFKQKWEELVAKGRIDLETTWVTKDGKEIYGELKVVAIYDNDGKYAGSRAVFHDLTERKRAEEKLRLFSQSVNSSIDGIAMGNLESKITYVNETFVRMFGYSKEELIGKEIAIIYPDDQMPKLEEALKATLEGGWTGELVGKRKDGELFPMAVSASRVVDDEGKVIAHMASHSDITERKRAEESLRLQSEIAANMSEGVYLIRASDGVIVYTNPKFEEIFGYGPDEMLGKHVSIVNAPTEKSPEETAKEISEFINKHGFWRGEINNIKKDGTPFWCYASVSMFDHPEHGKVWVVVHTDITERKRAEENLKKAKEEAEEANRLKSEFLANMSHEIRTPMNAIIGMSGIALDTDLTDEQREYLSIVKESGYALLGLLDDILDLSKIEADRIELETIDFDLRALVEGVTDTLAPRASVKGLELACLIHNQVPFLLRGDPGRLRQILMNLGGNATKFTEKGEVVIRVELEEETEDSATLQFSVTDTGIGILKDKQTKIFESFTQADGSTTRKYGGTGLGLSISRRLVELMGGKIGVDSQPGKGSRFWFTATLEKQKEFKDIPPASVPADIRGKRILVVDDNKTNRTILVKMLESFGCSAEAVESGDEAIKILKRAVHKEKLFDLVLLDMQMPEMDGRETLRAIKHDPEIKHVAVVILTSIGERGDAAQLQALGCAGYLMKPVKQSQLFDTIITVLSRQKAGTKEKPISIVTRHTIAEQKRRRVRILLAEDNPMNQKLAVALLKKTGYWVDAVENGRMAIEALNHTAYHLILMDVQMPEMNGFDATKAIREKEGDQKHTPIVAMTAYAMKGDQERCLQAGMDDYISKPIEPQELLDAIEKWTKSFDCVKAPPQPGKSKKDAQIKKIPIHLEIALLRFDGDKEFFKEMLQEFLNYAPEQLQILDEAINKGDVKAVEREAHSLKGAAGNLGAKDIANLSLKLELSGRTGDLAGTKEMIGNLKTEFKHLEKYINKSPLQEVALKS